MTLEATLLGNAVAGASDQTAVADTIFAIPFTVAEAGFAVAIEVAMKDGTVRPAAVLMADDGGAPGDYIAGYGWGEVNIALSSTVRYLTIPLLRWLATGDYWVGVLPWTGGAEDIKYDTGVSGDGFTIDGGNNFILSEPGATGVVSTATDRQYSIRVVMVGVADPPAGSGTGMHTYGDTGGYGDIGEVYGVAQPVSGPSSGGNRIGGSGAIRRRPFINR